MTKKKITSFDFGDGRGLIPAHQHINPDKSIGGWVADSVEFDAEAEVTIASKVHFSGYFKTYIRGGTFEGGTFEGGTFRGGDFWGGNFRGGVIKTNRDFIVFASCGRRNAPLTVQFEDETLLTTGCQSRITLAEFAAKVKATHGNNVWAQEYRAIIACVKTLAKIRQAEKEGKK